MCGKMIAHSTVKARKDHRCEACRVPIPAGYSYIRTVESDEDGKIYSSKWHEECRDEFDRMITENFDDCGDPLSTWEDDMPDEIKAKYLFGPWEQIA